VREVGRPYMLTDGYVEFLAVVRYLFCFPYRQLEGFARALNRLVPRLPSADYSGLRRILSLDLSLYESLRLSEHSFRTSEESRNPVQTFGSQELGKARGIIYVFLGLINSPRKMTKEDALKIFSCVRKSVSFFGPD